MNLRPAITALLAAAAFSAPAFAGISVLVNDRTAHKIWRLTDVNNDGVITPDEIFVWFDGTNAAGTPAISNLAAFNSAPQRQRRHRRRPDQPRPLLLQGPGQQRRCDGPQ